MKWCCTEWTATEFEAKALDFLNVQFAEIKQLMINFKPEWELDHLCYRTESLRQYEELKTKFLNFSDLLVESDVNGRPISSFELHKPILYRNWQIQIVELPAPKASKPTKEGFEHFEIVIDISFESFMRENQKLRYNFGGMNKSENPELEIELSSGNFKLHHQTLKSVIARELSIEPKILHTRLTSTQIRK